MKTQLDMDKIARGLGAVPSRIRIMEIARLC